MLKKEQKIKCFGCCGVYHKSFERYRKKLSEVIKMAGHELRLCISYKKSTAIIWKVYKEVSKM